MTVWRVRTTVRAMVPVTGVLAVLLLGGCQDREPGDWVGYWSDGDPAGDDDTVVDDDDDTGPADDDDTAVDDDDTAAVDADGDGYTEADGDCDDGDASVHPGADEGCDGVDTDCDGALGDDEVDDDGDGAYECEGDCDDTTTTMNVLDLDGDGATSCDGDCDDGDPALNLDDADGDGATSCDGDCDDGNDAVYPGAPEACGYGVDDDCDGVVDEDCTCPLYVDAGASGSAETGTWDDPFLEIADAIAALPEGCAEIHVSAGTYTGLIETDGLDLTLVGLDGAASTVVDAGGVGRCLKFKHATIVLEGFTLTNGQGDKGAGLHLDDVIATVRDCIVENNSCDNDKEGAGIFLKGGSDLTLTETVVRYNACDPYDGDNKADGGGLMCDASTLRVSGCQFVDNEAGDGGAMYLKNCTTTVDRTLVAGNVADDGDQGGGELHGGGGLLVLGGATELTNLVIADNTTGDRGAGVLLRDTVDPVVITNVTLVDNASSVGGAAVHLDTGGGLEMSSSILAFNNGEAGIDTEDAAAQPSLAYCDVWDNAAADYGANTQDVTGVDGNVSADPLFTSVSNDADWTNDDWSLDAASPCIDAGDPDAALNDPDGTRNDMGAYGGPYGGWP